MSDPEQTLDDDEPFDLERAPLDRPRGLAIDSTTFFQYKSVLKHAGIIAPHALGGSSSKGYNPDTDLWELAAETCG